MIHPRRGPFDHLGRLPRPAVRLRRRLRRSIAACIRMVPSGLRRSWATMLSTSSRSWIALPGRSGRGAPSPPPARRASPPPGRTEDPAAVKRRDAVVLMKTSEPTTPPCASSGTAMNDFGSELAQRATVPRRSGRSRRGMRRRDVAGSARLLSSSGPRIRYTGARFDLRSSRAPDRQRPGRVSMDDHPIVAAVRPLPRFRSQQTSASSRGDVRGDDLHGLAIVDRRHQRRSEARPGTSVRPPPRAARSSRRLRSLMSRTRPCHRPSGKIFVLISTARGLRPFGAASTRRPWCRPRAVALAAVPAARALRARAHRRSSSRGSPRASSRACDSRRLLTSVYRPARSATNTASGACSTSVRAPARLASSAS